MTWYVLQCKAHKDKVTEAYLASRGYEVYRPVIKSSSVGNGSSKTENMFPWYVFIRTNDIYNTYHKVKFTPGVISFLRLGSKIPSMSESMISDIRSLERYHLGQENLHQNPQDKISKVKIMKGPFSNDPCYFIKQRGSDRSAILLEILSSNQEPEVLTARLA